MAIKFPPDVKLPDDLKQDPVDGEREIAGFGRQEKRGPFGFSDPAGEYPKPDYHFESSINKGATGRFKHSLDIGGGDPTIDLSQLNRDLPPSSPSQYGDVDVMETKSGHVMVFDDTPSSQKILVKHNNGTGFELREDGSFVLRTQHNLIQSVAGTGALIIEGDLKISCKNLELDASGDVSFSVGGDFNLNVGGEKVENIDGSVRETVEGNKGSVVKKNKSDLVLGEVTETFLSGHNHSVKNNFESLVQGQHLTSSRGRMKASSQTEISQSSASINIAAADLAVFGYSGTIGGKEVVMYADNVHATDRVTSTSMHATSFVGDLNGTALRSNETASQNYGEAATSGSAFSYNDTTGTLKNTQQPTKDIVKEYLNFSNRNVKKVEIDPGDAIRKQIDLSEATGGKSRKPLNTRGARSRLKDENNVNDIKFTTDLVSRGVLSESFNEGVPPGVGRSTSGSGLIEYLPRNSIVTGAGQGGSKLIKGERVSNPFLPDSTYDPMRIPATDPRHINGSVLIGKGIPISTFLGTPSDKITLNHIARLEDRQEIARYLLMQTEVINLVKRDISGAFKDFRIIVAEGVYRPGPSETLSPGSIKDLARIGRAITYELYDDDNVSYPEITFEFAEHCVEYLGVFDKIVLHYDKFHPSRKIHSQVTVIMPEINSTFEFKTNPRYALETRFNTKTLSGTDLVEVIEAIPDSL